MLGLEKGMTLYIRPEYEPGGATGTFHICSIEDEDGNELKQLTTFLTMNGLFHYHLEDNMFIYEIKAQLKAVAIDSDILKSINIELI